MKEEEGSGAATDRGGQEILDGSAKLIAVIADEDTVTGMLLAGVGVQLERLRLRFSSTLPFFYYSHA